MVLKVLLRHTTLLDRVIVLLLLAATASSFLFLGQRSPGKKIVAERDGQIVFVAPLGENQTVSLQGPLGETVLSIRQGKARILASPCPHKACIGMGEVSKNGELLACVPNHLLVRIEGSPGTNQDYDLLSH